MDLKKYLKRYKMSQQEFADLVEVSKKSISNYICGKRKPCLAIALRIQEATDGMVSIKDLLDHWEKNEVHAYKEEND